MDFEEARRKVGSLIENVEKVFVGKHEVVKLAVTGLLAGGHILIEDVPGVGKTLLAQAIAKSVNGRFSRIQFTPDLLPSDIIGVSVFSQKEDRFVFRPGPLFTNILLADEINRTTPRTQSALLEAMNTAQVSVDGHTYDLSVPFMVLATQNPYEFEGTYPLPESQLDRFMMRLEIGYPSSSEEKRMILLQTYKHPLEELGAVMECEEIKRLQEQVKNVRIEVTLLNYLLEIVAKTRENKFFEVGASPRGALMFRRASQAFALVEGRDFVIPDDIKFLAIAVLAHRLILRGVARQDARKSAKILKECVDSVKVPL
ncbi:MAG: MoxR family ATPase [Planctomycetota bacterium]|nr:MoxR family ATPase [Planctomycetota bacterium]